MLVATCLPLRARQPHASCTTASLLHQALVFLSGEWSVRLRCRLRYRLEAELAHATHALVVPHAFTGTKEVVPLVKKQLVGAGQEVVGGCWFEAREPSGRGWLPEAAGGGCPGRRGCGGRWCGCSGRWLAADGRLVGGCVLPSHVSREGCQPRPWVSVVGAALSRQARSCVAAAPRHSKNSRTPACTGRRRHVG